jgi:hypothetical protein
MSYVPSEAIFFYNSPVGTFWIRAQEDHLPRVQLCTEEEVWGSYASAFDAASDFADHVTGCDEWDSRPQRTSDPVDLSQWQRGPAWHPAWQSLA